MVIDISGILKAEGATLNVDSELNIENLEFNGDQLKFSQPVKMKGSITNIGNLIRLEAQVSGKANVQCYRCMKDLVRDFSFEMVETFANDYAGASDSNSEDADLIHFQGNRLEISEIVGNNILINLPMRYLCSESCKGLCPECGENLNLTQCKCQKEEIDPRFEVLKKLLNEKNDQ